MSDPLQNVFAGAENAKAIGGFTSRLPIGTHTLLLKRFAVKESAKGKGKIVESDFHVLESNSANADETKGWAWFIGAAGWAGQYEEARLKQFIETVKASIGDTSTVSAMGAALAGPAQAGRGLMMKCTVSAQTNRDGSPKKSAAGEVYTEITWAPVSQSLEDIAAGRKHLDGNVKAAPATAPVEQLAAVATVAAAPATLGGMTSLLGSLTKK